MKSREFAAVSSKEDEARFEFYIDRGVETALARIKHDFEDAANILDRLPFHNTKHAADMVRRVDTILKAVQLVRPDEVTDRTRGMGKLLGAFHDVVQEWRKESVPEGKFVKVVRHRLREKNEYASAREAIAFMEEVNRDSHAEVFTAEDRYAAEQAIEATIPSFDAEAQTVFQAHLKEESPIITRALALADVGTAGMDGPVDFLEEGDALFREENLDILEALISGRRLGEEEKNYFRRRMLQWSAFQAVFVTGRKKWLERELRGEGVDVAQSIKNLFIHFDASYAACKERAARREHMNFEELAEDVGYARSA